jgi:hypothetical protein
MFRLHERTRLLLCRTGFFFLCVMPTFLLCGAAVHYRSSAYLEARREEWVAVLSDKLGLDVQIADLSYPNWNTAFLHQVILLDPESGNEVVRARYVEVTWEQGRWQVIAGQPEVFAESLPLLIDLANHRLLRGRSLQLAPLRFEAKELTFHGEEMAQTFQNIRADLATNDTGKRADVAFEVAGIPSSAPLELTIERQRTSSGGTTTCHLNTGETPLPCDALTPLQPWLKQLGSDAKFQGQVSLMQSAGGLEVGITGDLNQIDFNRLVSSQFPHHRLTGLADVQLQRMHFLNGRIVEMQGQLLTRGGGMVSRSLLAAVQQQLELTPADDEQNLALPTTRYSQFAFGFQLDAEGLSITGDENPANRGVIMSIGRTILLLESQRPIVPAALIIGAMSPRSEIQIPVTAEAKSLFDLLPLPALLPANDEKLPRAHVRLHKDD